jgi:hypothetical protein
MEGGARLVAFVVTCRALNFVYYISCGEPAVRRLSRCVSVFNILPGSCSLWQGAIVVMSNGRIMSPYAMESSPCSAQVCMVMFNVKGTALGHDAHIVV